MQEDFDAFSKRARLMTKVHASGDVEIEAEGAADAVEAKVAKGEKGDKAKKKKKKLTDRL